MLFGLFLEQIFGQWLVRASSGGFAAPNQSVSKSQPSDSRNYPAGVGGGQASFLLNGVECYPILLPPLTLKQYGPFDRQTQYSQCNKTSNLRTLQFARHDFKTHMAKNQIIAELIFILNWPNLITKTNQ